MQILEEIRTLLNGLPSGIASIISTGQYKSWLYKNGTEKGVVIPYEGKMIDEEFNNILLKSQIIPLASGVINGLSLSTDTDYSLWEFASVCMNFVDPGIDGKYREDLVKDPIDWWNRWKSLIGNSVTDPMVHSILGELVAFYYLVCKGKLVSWRGPDRGTHDFSFENHDYEVKSTISKNKDQIEASSIYQFAPSDTPLSLLFVGFDDTGNGICIDEIVQKLALKGINQDSLNSKLISLGYKIGRSVRKKKYNILRFEEYPVNEDFPYISPQGFEETGKGRITEVQYSINLAGLEHANLIDELSRYLA